MGSREMSKAAFAEAERLGHSWVGPEHGLLAILRGNPADTARMALEEAGLDADQFERHVERIERSDPKPNRDPAGGGISPNPGWYGAVGRAEGLAAGVGVSDVRPVDLLLALLWHTTEWLPEAHVVVPTDTSKLVHPLAALADVSLVMDELDRLRAHLVSECRRRGRSWTEVAAALGVARQSAWERYSSPDD